MKRDLRILPVILIAVLTATTASTPLFAAGDSDIERGMLWPDESHAFLGITVTWKLPKGGIPTPPPTPAEESRAYGTPSEKKAESTPMNQESESPLGQLEFKGPKTTLRGVNAPFALQGSNYVGGTLVLYIDDVFVYLKGYVMPGSSYDIQIQTKEYPSQRTIGGPSEDFECYVSSVCPLQLNDWTLSVSKEIKEFPDGSRALELTAANSKTGEQTSFPLVSRATRKIGRFQVTVKDSWKETNTAQIVVSADADPSVPGRDAFVQRGVTAELGTTLEDFLSQLAKQYHFEVEWVPYPDHPQSVDFLKSLKAGPSFGKSLYGKLGESLSQLFDIWEHGDNTYKVGALHWVDNTHLQVLPENYGKYLAAQEEKKKQEADEAKAKAQQQGELAKFKKLFAEKYSLQTKIYKLETLTPVTAKALVDPELRKYILLELPVDTTKGGLIVKADVEGYRRSVERMEEGSVCETGNTHLIISLAPDGKWPQTYTVQWGETKEESIPDDKANALIVKAIPSTQEKIAAMLGNMQKLASAESSEGPPPAPYRISAVLLQGVQAGEGSGSTGGETVSVRIEKSAGTVKDIPVKVGETVRPDDILVRLDPATVTDSQIDLLLDQLKNATEPDQKRNIEADIQQHRDFIAQNRLNAATFAVTNREAYRMAYRVASIDVKPGDHVLAGQQVATVTPIGREGQPSITPSTSLSDYGLRPDDLKTFGIANVSELGKGIVNLVPAKGDMGVARIALSSQYSLVLTYLDERKPYLIVKGTLVDDSRSHSTAKETSSTAQRDNVLLENTMYLEPGKPSLLGITNLRQALILVVRRLNGGDPASSAPAPSAPDTNK